MTQIKENSKLIVVTRKDLSPGAQACQATHVSIKFVIEHPEIAHEWYNISQYLVELSINNEADLLELSEKLRWKGILFSEFREPDFGNELTSIAIEPSEKARKVVSSMPLMLKEYGKEVESCIG